MARLNRRQLRPRLLVERTSPVLARQVDGRRVVMGALLGSLRLVVIVMGALLGECVLGCILMRFSYLSFELIERKGMRGLFSRCCWLNLIDKSR
jgi:hypothetical protein